MTPDGCGSRRLSGVSVYVKIPCNRDRQIYRVLLHCGVTMVLGDVLEIVLVGLRDTRLIKQD